MINLLESLSCDFESVKSGFLKSYLLNNLKVNMNDKFKNILLLNNTKLPSTINTDEIEVNINDINKNMPKALLSTEDAKDVP